MVNQNLGLPMKAPKSMSAYATEGSFMAGAYGLGDILKEQGYVQEIMIGATSKFGGLNYLYQTHGDYKIFDYDSAREDGFLPKNYGVWWGFEDDKLYKFAQYEITSLYRTGKPFNFTMETADTHMPHGYLAPGAPQPYNDHYANAIAYSTKQTVNFVRWIQSQPFYENTTVVLIGDHLSMDVDFFRNFDKDYLRTQYNLILNPSENVSTTDKSRFTNRQYANFDMLPTVLAAMGCEIEGNRLSLGTNLFSDEPTVMEKYGTEYVNEEIKKFSPYYSKYILNE